MWQPRIDNRHRDKDGTIARTHGNTLIRTLRDKYGHYFAPGCTADSKLSDSLEKLDEASLSQLVRDTRR